MGRDRGAVDQISHLERRLRDNVLRRLPGIVGTEKREEIESEFEAVTYELLKRTSDTFDSTLTVHPSEVGECMLRVAFGLRGFKRHSPIDPNPKFILTFEIGRAIHKILQGRYGLLGDIITFTPEVEISPSTSAVAERYNITGHCDGVFGDPGTSFNLGLEIKSMSGKRFAALMMTEQYQDQATIYLKCLSLSNMMFVFVDKNQSFLECRLYTLDEDRWDMLARKLDNTLIKVVRGEDVARSPNRIVCQSMCNFYKYCRPEV